LSNSSTAMALRLKQSMQGTRRNKKIIRSTSKGKQQNEDVPGISKTATTQNERIQRRGGIRPRQS
jgi:hypothetical protein